MEQIKIQWLKAARTWYLSLGPSIHRKPQRVTPKSNYVNIIHSQCGTSLQNELQERRTGQIIRYYNRNLHFMYDLTTKMFLQAYREVPMYAICIHYLYLGMYMVHVFQYFKTHIGILRRIISQLLQMLQQSPIFRITAPYKSC